MVIAATAPSIATADIGSKIAEITSKMGDGVKIGGVAAIRVAGVAATAIFTSQSVGVGSDKIPGVMMGGKTQTQSQSKAKEKDASCTTNNKNCKQGEHRGNIQAQEEKGMLVGTPAIAVWIRTKPPGYNYAVGAATAVRQALLAQKGKSITAKDGLVPGDRGDKFQAGANKAYATLFKILSDSKSNGIFAIPKKYEVSCYFDGTRSFGANKMLKKTASRRIDLTVHKGQLMGPGTL